MIAPKTVRESQVVMSQVMAPTDANSTGFVHGGTIMKLVDTAAAVASMRHARRRTTTARVDSFSFLSPIKVGDLVTVLGSVNSVGRTSMEVGVRVESEDLRTGTKTHVASAYLVFVALDEHGHPCPVPPLIPETDTERRRMAEAEVRRQYRAREAEVIRAYRRPACRSDISVICGPGEKVSVIGHRGAMGYAPENTMISFAKGLELGADIVEFDVHLSKDNQVIVMHDHTVNRTTDGTGLIKDMTLAELKLLDAGAWFAPEFAGERIPTLDEVLNWAKGKTKVAIEIKNGPVYYKGIEERVLDALRTYDVVESAMVISFDHHSVRKIKELEPRLTTGILYVARPVDDVSLAAAANADVIMPNWAYVTQNVIDNAHRAKLVVLTWLLNDTADMELMIALGVDGIGTNYPDRLRQLVDREQKNQ